MQCPTGLVPIDFRDAAERDQSFASDRKIDHQTANESDQQDRRDGEEGIPQLTRTVESEDGEDDREKDKGRIWPRLQNPVDQWRLRF